MRGLTIAIGVLAILSAACSTPAAPSTMPLPSPATQSPAPAPSGGPAVSSISPASAIAGSGDITVTITGSAFEAGRGVDASFGIWLIGPASIELRTQFVSDSQLTVDIPATFLKTAGTAQIKVVNGDAMGWSDGYHGYPQSNAVSFSILPPLP